MTKASAKLRFHLALYATRFLPLSRLPQPPPTPPERLIAGARRIFYWTPADTAGANVIVHDIMPALHAAAARHAPDWSITAGQTLPDGKFDALISFKAVPLLTLGFAPASPSCSFAIRRKCSGKTSPPSIPWLPPLRRRSLRSSADGTRASPSSRNPSRSTTSSVVR